MARFRTGRLIEVDGSLLDEAGYVYNPETYPIFIGDVKVDFPKALVVKFRKTQEWWMYLPMDYNRARELFDADSIGKTFYARIRDNMCYDQYKLVNGVWTLHRKGWTGPNPKERWIENVDTRAAIVFELAMNGAPVTKLREAVEKTDLTKEEARLLLDELFKHHPKAIDFGKAKPSDNLDSVESLQETADLIDQLNKPARKLTPKEMFSTAPANEPEV